MRRFIVIGLCGTLVLAGCGFGQSRLNPLNWFGSAQEVPVDAELEKVNPLIPTSNGLFASLARQDKEYLGSPVQSVTSLVIERVPGGAIVRATGLAATAGVYDVQLTAENEEKPVDGVLTYRLEGIEPARVVTIGTQAQRQITAARSLTNQQLAGVRSIRVESASNAQVSRRR
ncbi:MAG: hypothetical protein HRU30_17175 [Rhodobacteraceae bacterium]|nr:hypothetical protein [Paracoccaceae bacterium]